MNQIQSIEKIQIERNLQNRVYGIIKNYLMRPDVPAGTHLYEDRLAREIGVSRTPVKEHRRILDALRMNDIPLAISRTRENFRAAIRAMEQRNSNYPGLFR